MTFRVFSHHREISFLTLDLTSSLWSHSSPLFSVKEARSADSSL